MEIIIKKINGKVQHLNEVLPAIPTNTILNKTITGCGATYTEIKTKRNSIIIEPNRPVIYGKCNDSKHKKDNLFGVFEGVYTDDIVKYVWKSQERGKFIKIMTTPESFSKVRSAFEELDIDIRFEGYFLLFDECQKMVKDSGYRANITLPIEFFFQCKNKAIVSATPPNEFSDDRFENFEVLKIKPDYDYSQDIELQTSNNVLQTLKENLTEMQDSEQPIFLFVNYTDMIYSIMTQLGILEDSAVFCSQKSVEKLKSERFRHAYEDWKSDRQMRYNFMTSRFYSALDIEFDDANIKPNVILLTDCFKAEYTMFDPYMDTVQVVGRFRNSVSKLVHISNTDFRIKIWTRPQIVCSYQCEKFLYDRLCTFRDNCNDDLLNTVYTNNIALLNYNKFLDETGKENGFLIDNYINDDYIKTFYNSHETLCKAYTECDYFNVKHIRHQYKLGDYEKLKFACSGLTIKEKRVEIVKQLEILGDCTTEAELQYKTDLSFVDTLLVRAYDMFGKEAIESMQYSTKKMKEAIILKEHKQKTSSGDIIKLININFKNQHWYSCAMIKKRLKEIFDSLNISPPKAITSHTINDYFEAVEQKKKEGRGYYLFSSKFRNVT